VSRWPFPDKAHDGGTIRTLRGSIFDHLYLVATVGMQIGIVDAQYAALKAGRDVTFTTEQLKSFYPRGDEHPDLPANLDAAEAWVLRGDSTLEPVS